MKRFMQCALILALAALLCVPAMADGDFARVEYGTAQIHSEATFKFVDAESGDTLWTHTVPDAKRAHNEITIEMLAGYCIDGVECDVGEINNRSGSEDGFTYTYTWTGAMYAKVLFTITVSGFEEPVKTPLTVSYFEALKMLHMGSVRVDENVSVTGVTVSAAGCDAVELVKGNDAFTGELTGEPGALAGTIELSFSASGSRGRVEVPLSALSADEGASGVSLASDGVCAVEFYVNGRREYLRMAETGEAVGELPSLDAKGFAGWMSGGEAVDAAEVVRGDMRLKAAFTEVTGHDGSSVRISNADNSLLKAIESKCGRVDPESVKIRLDGANTSGNAGYAGNGWAEDMECYVVANCTSESDMGGAYVNEHVPFDELEGITVYAEYGGKAVKASFTSDELGLDIDGERASLTVGRAREVELKGGSGAAYMDGRGAGNFAPEESVTRAEAATLFYRCLTDESASSLSQRERFADVDSGAWYCDAVSLLAGAGLIDGDGAYFRPDEPITRAAFIAMAVRALGEDDYSGPDLFNDISGCWARDCINAAAELRLISGYPDGGFHPEDGLTRAEAVKIVNTLLRRGPEYGRVLSEVPWNDVAENAWYYTDVVYASSYFYAY